MRLLFCLITALLVALPDISRAAPRKEYIIVSGGPALRKWENYRPDAHDQFWGNFVATAVYRMRQIKAKQGDDAQITWLVYRKAYEQRGREDGKPYTMWIKQKEAKEGCRVVWFDSGDDVIQYINRGQSRSRVKIANFEFFGHSNRHAFLFDYSSDILGASVALLHEKDLKKIRSSAFFKDAHIKSWGCHTGESMSKTFRRHTGRYMWGALRKTDYSSISQGKLPTLTSGVWTR